jgi:DNA polymerase-3 subunit epsilon
MIVTPRQIDLFKLAVDLYPIAVNPEKYLILDTETTGLGQFEIIEIAITDLNGGVILDTLVKPTKFLISEKAREVHGITDDEVKDSPTFLELFPKFKSIVENKTVLIYNAKFDISAIQQSTCLKLSQTTQFQCLMLLYSTFKGQLRKNGGYKWQKLPEGNHRALGDCLACVEIIKEMFEELNPKVLAELPFLKLNK